MLIAVVLSLSACNTQQFAMRSRSPKIIGAFIPGLLKSNEGILKVMPDDQRIILETGSFYVMYANAFVESPAKMIPPDKYEKREAEFEKARQNYARGVEILRTGLEKKYPGISEAYMNGKSDEYIEKFTKDDVPLIYWLTAGTLCAFSMNPFDLSFGTKIAEVSLYIKKAYELDPDWGDGMLDEFFLLYYASLPVELGGDKTKAPLYYQRALEKSKGLNAGLYVSWLECIDIPEQNYEDFKEKVKLALAVNSNKAPDNRLINTIAQRKAKYYLKNAVLFFAEAE
ncbi:hypothetical protein FACS189494_02810 [Spirochaetia bacterium]|nr:hypothetical protein FACS189494_02810 [Spirochaetia bacterium]